MKTQTNEKQTNVMQQPAAVWQDEVLTDLSLSDEQAEQTKGGPGPDNRSGGNYFTGSITVSGDG
jgi:hypothetical protein